MESRRGHRRNRLPQLCASATAERELEAKASGVDAAVYDLKAVNPNAVTQIDERTPQEIIESIEQQGRIVSDALSRLRALLKEVN